MAKCIGFRNFKERGEWVELQFMAKAVRKHFKVLKPWGDSSAYDVGVEHGQQFLRVQVKSTSHRVANGYQCGFRPNQRNKRQYTTRQIDFFAAYVVEEDAWYIIPAAVVLKTKSLCLMLCPVRKQKKRSDSYRYECYREAWHLLRSGKKPRAVAAEVETPTLAAKISFGKAVQEIFEHMVEFLWVVDEEGVAVPVESLHP
jgi:hypothetical protein